MYEDTQDDDDILKCNDSDHDEGTHDIYAEPENCTEIETLADELQKYRDEKPIDIYLAHC